MTTQRMPAEWEEHRATWIAWPYLESDYPGKVDAVRWAYCEFIRHVSKTERVEILCLNGEIERDAALGMPHRKRDGGQHQQRPVTR